MLINDLILFAIEFGLQALCFFVLHYTFFRIFSKKDILPCSIPITLCSIAVTSCADYYLFASKFSSYETFVISVLGNGLAAFFMAGVYIFLFPITADRSIASQMMIHFLTMAQEGMPRELILQRFVKDNVIQKRLDECRHAKLLVEEKGKFILTAQGKRVALLYWMLFRIYRLEKREGFNPYFIKSEK